MGINPAIASILNEGDILKASNRTTAESHRER